MHLTLAGIVVLVGSYGSGKTEVAINLAAASRRSDQKVQVVDLDLVNPYFRSREATAALAAKGIRVVMPDKRYFHADLPILSPEVAGLIRASEGLTLLDAGGSDAGARVLGALAHALETVPIQVLQVVNPMRPETENLERCLEMGGKIEAAAKLTIDGYIGNANLMDATDVELIEKGYGFVRELARRTEKRLVCVTAPAHLMVHLKPGRMDCPVLAIARQLVPPWRQPEPLAR